MENRRLLWAAALMLSGVLLVGCGEEEPDRESPTPPDVDSGTNINTGVGNEGAPEPSDGDEPDEDSQ